MSVSSTRFRMLALFAVMALGACLAASASAHGRWHRGEPIGMATGRPGGGTMTIATASSITSS